MLSQPLHRYWVLHLLVLYSVAEKRSFSLCPFNEDFIPLSLVCCCHPSTPGKGRAALWDVQSAGKEPSCGQTNAGKVAFSPGLQQSALSYLPLQAGPGQANHFTCASTAGRERVRSRRTRSCCSDKRSRRARLPCVGGNGDLFKNKHFVSRKARDSRQAK